MKNLIYKSTPSLKVIGFGIIGTIFFGGFAYQMLSTDWVVEEGTNLVVGNIIMWVFTLGFIFFSVASFSLIVSIKIIELTEDTLTIRRPLLFYKQRINLDGISGVSQKDYKIDTSRGFSTYNVYRGLETTISLKSGKSIKYNSFEIGFHDSLNHSIKKQLRKLRSGNSPSAEEKKKIRQSQVDWDGFGWLLFLGLLTIGLVYGIMNT